MYYSRTSPPEACQSEEIQVKRETEKEFFSQLFNQFSKDLEKSGTSNKGG